MSKKPCPGCGQVDRHRRADEICSDCREKFQRVKVLEQELAKINRDRIVVAYGEYAHWNQYIYTHATSGKYGREIMRVMHALVLSLVAPVAEDYVRGYGVNDTIPRVLGKNSQGIRYGTLPQDVTDTIIELRNVIQLALDEAYEAGKHDGSSVLMRFAAGDISMADFDKFIQPGAD